MDNTQKKDEKDLKFNNIYQAKKKISAGSFGTVYSGVDLNTNEAIALKLEKISNDEIRSVLREAQLLEKLQGMKGIPKIYWSGTKAEYDVLVLQLLGKDLGSYLKIYKKFSLKTVVMIGDQLLALLEEIHSKNIVHRDLKPENILMGRAEQGDTVFIVDFGISKIYRDSNGRHMPFKDKKSFVGTTRYASLAAHNGHEVSRKDDLESLGYVLLYLAKGILPWQNLTVSEKEKTKKVGEMKEKMSMQELCKDLPEEFLLFMNYTKNLTFKQDPDYKLLRDLMKKVSLAKNFVIDNKWDWNLPFQIEKKVRKKTETVSSGNNIKISLVQENPDLKIFDDRMCLTPSDVPQFISRKPTTSSSIILPSNGQSESQNYLNPQLSSIRGGKKDINPAESSQNSSFISHFSHSIQLKYAPTNTFNTRMSFPSYEVRDDELKEYIDKDMTTMIKELKANQLRTSFKKF